MSFILTSSNPRSLRTYLLGKIALPAVLFYRKLFKGHKSAWNENRTSLKRFPTGSVGKCLSDFLFENDIDLEAKMENHDFFHVVLGYTTSLPEEAALHFFLIGNGKGSRYPYIAAFVGFVIFPEYYDLYIDAYHRGKSTEAFVHLNHKDFLGSDLNHLRESIGLPERLL
ncbi:MAG: hypothetical protein AAF487_07265 [Bacteroidota bacterium]